MKRVLIALALLLAISLPARAQQTIVFPAVSDEVEGLNGSLWVTVARIIKVDPGATVTLRRKWVCLPDGWFPRGPGEPSLTWQMPAEVTVQGRIIQALGG